MNKYYCLTFLTGFGLLAFEVFGPRLMQPHFGQSPILWASTISVFLGGMTCGYFFGGKISSKNTTKNIKKITSLIWLSISILVIFSPEISNFIASIFLEKDPTRWEPLLISFLNFFIPAILMGTAFPTLVELCPSAQAKKGEHAGILLAISTLGSILGVLSLYFWLITTFNTSQIAIFLSIPWLISIVILKTIKK
tara:strand:- start:2387 stop:2971 length:585 start_codon:yes stop_codon:yes gene_type:complete